MTGLDAIVLAIVAVFALRGLFRGFLREAFAVLAWVGGLVIAFLYAAELAPTLAAKLDIGRPLDRWIAGVALFLSVYVAMQATGWILHRIAHAVFLAPVDRLAGLLLGATKGAVLCGIAFWLAAARFGPEMRERIQASAVAGGVLRIADQLVTELAPPEERSERS